MNLTEYFARPNPPSYVQFAAAVGAQSDVAVRSWVKGNRRPSPEFCPAIEVATTGLVRRWDVYPDSWWRIWPELVGSPEAPALPPGIEPIRYTPAV